MKKSETRKHAIGEVKTPSSSNEHSIELCILVLLAVAVPHTDSAAAAAVSGE